MENYGQNSEENVTEPVLSKYRSVLDIVYTTLRDEILTQKLKPGDTLNTIQLSKRLGASRTPIREALNRLASIGLVEYIPHRGAFVKTLSVQEIIEIYYIRAALAGIAARLGTGKLSEEQKQELLRLCDRMEDHLSRGEYNEMLEANLEFHSIVYKAAQSPRLESLILQYYRLSTAYRALGLELPGRYAEICREHRNVAQALIDEDIGRAEFYAREHHFNTARRIAKSTGSDINV